MTVTLLHAQCNGWSTDSPTSYTTPSLNLGSNCGIIILFGLISGNTVAPTAISAVTDSGGGTSGTTGQVWESLVPSTAEIAFTSNGHIWGRAIGGTAVNGVTITCDWIDSSNQVFAIAVIKVDGTDWNAADPWGGSVHKVVNNAGDGPDSATLSAAPAAGGYTFAMCMADEDSTNSKAATWSSAHGTWTVLADGTNTVLIADRHSFSFAYRTGSTDAVIDLTDVNTGNDSYSHMIMGIVTKPSGGGGTTVNVGPASETDTAGALARSKRKTAGVTAETDTAGAFARSKRKAIGVASETDSARPAMIGTYVVGTATETDLAVAFAKAKRKTVGLAGETDTAVAVARSRLVSVGTATETDLAVAFAKAKRKAVGVAAETDSAITVPVPGAHFPVPTSVDTTSRKFLDQHGDPWLMLDISSWGMAQNLSNADIVTAMQGVADRHFNCVVVCMCGLKMTGFSGWDGAHNEAGDPFWTGTPWASSLGSGWASVDKVVSEAALHGIVVALSVAIFTATQGMEEELNAVTTTQAYNAGLAIGQRYAGSPNVIWHIEGESGFSATNSTGLRMDALFHGFNDGTGTPRLLVAEPYLNGNGYDMYINQQLDHGNTGGYQHLLLSADSVYEYTGDAVDILDDGWGRTSTYPVWDCEPPYSGAGHYDGNQNVAPSATERQQMRERNLSVMIRGGVGINWGHEMWWPFGAQGLFSISGVTWQDVPTKTETYEAQYCWDLILDYCRDLTWAPTDSFITTGTGTGDTKAASGMSGTAILAYFPNNRTIVVDTTLFTGSGSVRLRWYDPTAGTYASIVNSEAQNASRSVTLPAARGDGSRDFVLVVDAAIVDAGVASEVDSAGGVGRSKRRTLGVAGETDVAGTFVHAKRRTLGVAPETDAALAVTWSKRKALGVATETDVALAVTWSKRKALGVATETDAAGSFARSKRRVISPAGETDTALTIIPLAAGQLGVASESDVAIAVAWSKRRATSPAVELDSAIAIVRGHRLTLGPATEVGIALAVLHSKRRTLGVADEVDRAIAIVASGGVGEGPTITGTLTLAWVDDGRSLAWLVDPRTLC